MKMKAAMTTRAIIQHGLRKRYARETRFQWYGRSAIIVGIMFLGFLLAVTLGNAYQALHQTYIHLDIHIDRAAFGATPTAETIAAADYNGMLKNALRAAFPEVKTRRQKKALYSILSVGAKYDLAARVRKQQSLIGQQVAVWLLADDEVDGYMKGRVNRDIDQKNRRMQDQTIDWIERLIAQGKVEKYFNMPFFFNGDSREPEQAGIAGAVMGSLYAIMVTMLLAFPIGVAAAVYLQEFAARNRLTDLIEVNINNLAAVPSIIFGLLGVAIFINFFGLPRSVPLVGGMVLALMTLPTIIISSRAALAAVPPSMREAALAVGASPLQTTLHHVLPLALPGMLTGAIIGLAQALGETAPLLVIGMVAFIADIPSGPLDPGTALPVQIYLWSDSPERAFVERTSAAIMVLLLFLVAVNGLIVLLRKKLARRW